MIEGAGVVRSAGSLAAAGATVEALGAEMGPAPARPTGRHGELANLVTAAASVLRSATVRCETRGAHARSDHPETPMTGGVGASCTTPEGWPCWPVRIRAGLGSMGRDSVSRRRDPEQATRRRSTSTRRTRRWSRPWPGPSPRTCCPWAT